MSLTIAYLTPRYTIGRFPKEEGPVPDTRITRSIESGSDLLKSGANHMPVGVLDVPSAPEWGEFRQTAATAGQAAGSMARLASAIRRDSLRRHSLSRCPIAGFWKNESADSARGGIVRLDYSDRASRSKAASSRGTPLRPKGGQILEWRWLALYDLERSARAELKLRRKAIEYYLSHRSS
jgi:hypothetical protein